MKHDIKLVAVDIDGTFVHSDYSYDYPRFRRILARMQEAGCRFEFNGYSGFSSGYNRPDWLLNLRLAKSIGSFTISLTAHDILGTSKSFSHMASAEYVEDTYRNNPGRCILVGLSYNFGTWNFRKQSRMEMLERRSNL